MILSLALLACTPKPADTAAASTADLRLEGTIYLSATEQTDAIAVADGVVVAVGAAAAAMDAAEVVALGDEVAVPGFHDAHTHLLPGSFVQARLVMFGTGSMDNIVSSVASYAADNPDEPWIIGYGWVYSLLSDPDGLRLDEAVSDRPVLVVDSAGHNALVNSAALAAAGITADTPDPEGGQIVRDPETGEPTGLLLEEALSLVSTLAIADYGDDDFIAAMREPLEQMSAAGLTSISDIMASPGFDLSFPWIFQALDEAGELPLRVHYHLPVFEPSMVADAVALGTQYDTERVRMAGIKLWVDGSSSSAEGWVSEPIAGSTDNYGSAYFTVDELIEVTESAEDAGLRMRLHVTGDAAVSAALEAMEVVAALRGGLQQQHTLEHVVLIQPEDRVRMAELGVVASLQPTHATVASAGNAPDAWGEERFAQAYDLRALADAGVPLALGTDWPVWPVPDAPVNLRAAQVLDTHSLTAAEAFTAYTAGSARAAGLADTLGCLQPGCLADITVLSDDPLTTEADALATVGVEQVYVGGVRVR